MLTPASQIKSAKQKFAWDPYIPLGTVTIFAGRGGEGKSSLALYAASLIQSGSLPGDLHGEPRAVLIVGHEDDWGTVMKPRLVAAGADLDHVFKLTIQTVVDEVTRETVPAFPLDMDLIRKAIEETNAGLIIVDPITSTIAGDLHKVADVRRALNPLMELAQETRSAVVAIMHFNKGTGNVSDKLSGSHAFRDASRSVMLFATDEETGQRIVTLDKSSYSDAQGKSFAFNLESVTVPTDDGDTTEVARVEYLGETELSVNDIVNRVSDDSGMESDRTEAEQWLISYLEDQGGAAPAGDIRKASLADGLSWDTVKRTSLKITDKAKSGFQGKWVWTLDTVKGSTKGAMGAGVREPAPFAPLERPLTVEDNPDLTHEDTKSAMGAKSAGIPALAPLAPFAENVAPVSIIGSTRCAFHPAAEPKPDGSCGICRAEAIADRIAARNAGERVA